MDTDQELIKERLGGFNDYPPNCEVVEHAKFLHLWEVKPARRTYQYRQVRGPYNRTSYLHFWIFPDWSGIGWRTDYDGKYSCKHFKFAWCEHDWETIVSRMTYRVYVCKKCGYRDEVDSSG